MAATQTYPWAPDVDYIARLSPAYTEGGFDDDNAEPGQQGTFTESTEPTDSEVEDMIVTACEEVSGRVGVAIPSRCFSLARVTAAWHVSAAIAGDKMPAGTDDSGGEYRTKILNYRNSLDSLVELARMPCAPRLK